MNRSTGTSPIDLHTHTTASDGSLEPAALVALARDNGVQVMAITDHDTTAGIPAAQEAGKALGVRIMAGVEMSIQEGSQWVHLLGLAIRHDQPTLVSFFHDRLEKRRRRFVAMVERLRTAGITLDADVALASIPGQPGRLHLARALVKGRWVQSTDEAFEKYLGNGKPAHVPYTKLSVAEATRIIVGAGGVPILAHPGLLERDDEIPQWVQDGVMGLEVIHPRHDSDRHIHYMLLAASMGLLVSGGSDFHQPSPDLLPGHCGPSPAQLAAIENRAADVASRDPEEVLTTHRRCMEKLLDKRANRHR